MSQFTQGTEGMQPVHGYIVSPSHEPTIGLTEEIPIDQSASTMLTFDQNVAVGLPSGVKAPLNAWVAQVRHQLNCLTPDNILPNSESLTAPFARSRDQLRDSDRTRLGGRHLRHVQDHYHRCAQDHNTHNKHYPTNCQLNWRYL